LEKLYWRFLTSIRHRCRRRHHRGDGAKGTEAEGPGGGDRRGRGDRDAATRRTSASAIGGDIVGGMACEATANTLSWTELAREAAHVSIHTYL